jgi:endonuclease/exonuclease/phosphatase family metal-dependent hydrolase
MFRIIIFDKKRAEMKKSPICLVIIFMVLITGCSHSPDKDSIKVMTVNIRYDNPADSINAWPNRMDLFHSFITTEKPDIIGMQEVLWTQYTAMDSLFNEYSSVGVGREDGARAGEMNPIYFLKEKFDLVRTITFWLSDSIDLPGSKGWGASLPRIVTWMELVEKKNHEHFFCFNTHFAHDSDSARMMSSRILLHEVGKITEGFPFIITGDFNMGPSSQGYAILTGPAESVPLLSDSYLISEKKPAGPASTFNGFADNTRSGRIDYVFVRNGMKVLSHETFREKKNNIFISDHWPVMARILLK